MSSFSEGARDVLLEGEAVYAGCFNGSGGEDGIWEDAEEGGTTKSSEMRGVVGISDTGIGGSSTDFERRESREVEYEDSSDTDKAVVLWPVDRRLWSFVPFTVPGIMAIMFIS